MNMYHIIQYTIHTVHEELLCIGTFSITIPTWYAPRQKKAERRGELSDTVDISYCTSDKQEVKTATATTAVSSMVFNNRYKYRPIVSNNASIRTNTIDEKTYRYHIWQ